MECSKCGGKTKVIGTRSPSKPGKGSEVKRAESVVAWYTSDFVVRVRKCLKCGKADLTVELLVTDVSRMIEEAAKGHFVDPWSTKTQ